MGLELNAAQQKWCSQALRTLRSKTKSQALNEYVALTCKEAEIMMLQRPNKEHPFCVDSTRVPLIRTIDANFIKVHTLHSMPDVICSAQPERREDFWEMVIKNECKAIVKLTEDSGQEYFPLVPGESQTYGSIKVTNKSVNRSALGVVSRVLEVSNEEQSLQVCHFQYGWSDLGVPRTTQAILEIFTAIYETSSYVVHCRAGIGRAGTFVTIDHILRRILNGDASAAQISDVLSQLRTQRRSLVETAEQYWFCYRAVSDQLEALLLFAKKKEMQALPKAFATRLEV